MILFAEPITEESSYSSDEPTATQNVEENDETNESEDHTADTTAIQQFTTEEETTSDETTLIESTTVEFPSTTTKITHSPEPPSRTCKS
jgi:hypothetical protein